MQPDAKGLVRWFVGLKREHGWSQTCAALKLGVDQSTISDWEIRVDKDEVRDPRPRTLERLVEFYAEQTESPTRAFKSPLIRDVVCKAEKPGSFHVFRGAPHHRDAMAAIYARVLKKGASVEALHELDQWRDDILRAHDKQDQNGQPEHSEASADAD